VYEMYLELTLHIHKDKRMYLVGTRRRGSAVAFPARNAPRDPRKNPASVRIYARVTLAKMLRVLIIQRLH
jgi:hypothetical protein